jgi:polyribonucleotide nucleotidyltransferase
MIYMSGVNHGILICRIIDKTIRPLALKME